VRYLSKTHGIICRKNGLHIKRFNPQSTSKKSEVAVSKSSEFPDVETEILDVCRLDRHCSPNYLVFMGFHLWELIKLPLFQEGFSHLSKQFVGFHVGGKPGLNWKMAHRNNVFSH
jgi:hypothetical protein